VERKIGRQRELKKEKKRKEKKDHLAFKYIRGCA